MSLLFNMSSSSPSSGLQFKTFQMQMEHKLTSFPKVSNSHFEKNDKPRIAAAGAIGVDLREQLMPMQQ